MYVIDDLANIDDANNTMTPKPKSNARIINSTAFTDAFSIGVVKTPITNVKTIQSKSDQMAFRLCVEMPGRNVG